MAASFSPSSRRPGWAFDVFLSFRGEDTRKNFTDHLYTALAQAGIHTFRDNDELPRGEEISSEILKAIQESRISLVVFSKGYASSTWCLDELTEIMDCKNIVGQIVLPVFYDIDPSDVRKQKGSFADAFGGHEQRFKEEPEKVNKWRGALVTAANLSGWDLQSMANGHESKLIQEIVEDVSRELNPKYLNIAAHPVGIDSQVEDIIDSLRVSTNDVRIVAVYGMPGIGKTTLAKAVFNQLRHRFEGSSCLLDISKNSKQPNGLLQLQKQLLHDICRAESRPLFCFDVGSQLIKKRLCQKRVLVVFDDVNQRKQLNAFNGDRHCFGPGSRVIITTRDERWLTKIGVDEKYPAKELSDDESIQLFSWHAFGEPYPKEDYIELSKDVVRYTGGLPLALEVLASFLLGRSIPEWVSAIEKLQKIPDNKIQSKLKTSFDALEEDTLKEMFLDIACFFIGMDKEYVAQILDARCGFNAEIYFRILIERSLLTINNQNELKMHHLLRDMGREIVRQMSPTQLGERSRLWCHKDVLVVLEENMGTKIVEGITLDAGEQQHVTRSTKSPLIQKNKIKIRTLMAFRRFRGQKILERLPLDAGKREHVNLSTKSFAKMTNLQLLKFNGVHLAGSYKHLSKQSKWLSWHYFPLKYFPTDFELKNLVVLDMQRSYIKKVRGRFKHLQKLKTLNLSHSSYLAETPNFSQLWSLERLVLQSCVSLVEIDQSIGCSERLVFLNLEGCNSLKQLPESICLLKFLKTLNIEGCSRLEKFPDNLGDMESLTELLAARTSIMQLPRSFENLNLKIFTWGHPYSPYVYLQESALWQSFDKQSPCLPSFFIGLSSLRRLYLGSLDLSQVDICINFNSLSSLQDLTLEGSEFFNLPSGIGCLPELEKLNLQGCSNLCLISELPSSLKVLDASYCTCMERISIQTKTAPDMLLKGCWKLVEIQGLESVKNKPVIYMEGCNNLAEEFKKILLQVLLEGKLPEIVLPASKVPDWFGNYGNGSSLSFCVPGISQDEAQGLVVWVVYGEGRYTWIDPFFSVTIRNKGVDDSEFFYMPSYFPIRQDYFQQQHSWVIYIPFGRLPFTTQDVGEFEVSVKASEENKVEQCGVHLTVN